MDCQKESPSPPRTNHKAKLPIKVKVKVYVTMAVAVAVSTMSFLAFMKAPTIPPSCSFSLLDPARLYSTSARESNRSAVT